MKTVYQIIGGIFVVTVLIFLVIFITQSINHSEIRAFEPKLQLNARFESQSFDINSQSAEQVTDQKIEQLILDYTNKERRKYGLSEFRMNQDLSKIAEGHSQDMAKNHFFSHINLAGENPSERAERDNFDTRKYLGDGFMSTGIAENIAKMPTGNVVGIGFVNDEPDDIAKVIVISWMESVAHSKNILNSQYTDIGIGVAFDGKYYYATQNFW